MGFDDILAIARLGIELARLLLVAAANDDQEEGGTLDDGGERTGGAVVIDWGDCSPEYGSRRRRRY